MHRPDRLSPTFRTETISAGWNDNSRVTPLSRRDKNRAKISQFRRRRKKRRNREQHKKDDGKVPGSRNTHRSYLQ